MNWLSENFGIVSTVFFFLSEVLGLNKSTKSASVTQAVFEGAKGIVRVVSGKEKI